MKQIVVMYFVGGIAAIVLADRFWYPMPDVHGVALGLLMAAIFVSGSAVAIGILIALRRVFKE